MSWEQRELQIPKCSSCRAVPPSQGYLQPSPAWLGWAIFSEAINEQSVSGKLQRAKVKLEIRWGFVLREQRPGTVPARREPSTNCWGELKTETQPCRSGLAFGLTLGFVLSPVWGQAWGSEKGLEEAWEGDVTKRVAGRAGGR